MLSFHQGMDPYSLDVRRDGNVIAMIQWHKDRPPRIVQYGAHFFHLDLNEMKDVAAKLEERYLLECLNKKG